MLSFGRRQPIYYVSRKASEYRVRRWRRADVHVENRFKSVELYGYIGGRPYFADEMNPPMYVDGVRVDGYRYGHEENSGDLEKEVKV